MESCDISDNSSDLSSPPASPVAPSDYYPSPPPSQDLDNAPKSLETSPDPVKAEPAPARKKRKVEPKPRITRYLNLNEPTDGSKEDQDAQLNLLLTTLRKRRRIVVVAGAGISVSAGIPDFRSSHGLFSSLKKNHKLKASGKQLFDASVVYQDETMISSFHDMVRSLSGMATRAQPTAFHHLMASLAQNDRLLRLYTQNVDGIETSLPPLTSEASLGVKGPWPPTIQLHGGLEKMVCQKCRHTSSFQPDLFQGPDPPLCPVCCEIETARTSVGQRSRGVGKLRPKIVLYNEHNPDEEAIGSVVSSDLRTRPEVLVVVGTSLKIPGVRRIVKEMCRVVRGRKDGVTIWINQESAPVGKEFENCWDLVIKGDCDEVARHVGLKKWDDNSDKVFDECTHSEVERVKNANGDISIPVSTPGEEGSQNNARSFASNSNPDIALDKNVAKPTTDSVENLGEERLASRPSGKRKNNSKQPRKTRAKQTATTTAPNNTINFKKTKPFKRRDSEKINISIPMHPVSDSAARNNGPIPLESDNKSAIHSLDPPLDKTNTIYATKIPKNMEMILN